MWGQFVLAFLSNILKEYDQFFSPIYWTFNLILENMLGKKFTLWSMNVEFSSLFWLLIFRSEERSKIRMTLILSKTNSCKRCKDQIFSQDSFESVRWMALFKTLSTSLNVVPLVKMLMMTKEKLLLILCLVPITYSFPSFFSFWKGVINNNIIIITTVIFWAFTLW